MHANMMPLMVEYYIKETSYTEIWQLLFRSEFNISICSMTHSFYWYNKLVEVWIWMSKITLKKFSLKTKKLAQRGKLIMILYYSHFVRNVKSVWLMRGFSWIQYTVNIYRGNYNDIVKVTTLITCIICLI